MVLQKGVASMFRKRLLFTLILAATCLFSASLFGCGAVGNGSNGNGVNFPNGNGSTSEYTPMPLPTDDREPPNSAEVKPVIELPEIMIPIAAGIAVEENDQAIIDFSNKQDGYIMAKYLEDVDVNIRLLITVPDGIQYTYSLIPGRDFEAFPLSGGDGSYEIGVYKQVEGTRYAMVLSLTIDVELINEFAPFLRPNQFVNFNRSSDAVRKAAELTYGLDQDDVMEKVKAIYQFVITNIEYDIELAETVRTGYIPNIDEVLRRGKGICFDYAALMAAMLRSQGIPTKLVIGYTGDLYHAWISVYSAEEGWIDGIIFFDGNDWQLVDPTVAANIASTSLADFIGDGTHYTAKFFH